MRTLGACRYYHCYSFNDNNNFGNFHKNVVCLWFISLVSPGSSVVKNMLANERRCRRQGFDPWVRKILWRRKWRPVSVFLSGKPHGRTTKQATIHRVAESDTTEHANTYLTPRVKESMWKFCKYISIFLF